MTIKELEIIVQGLEERIKVLETPRKSILWAICGFIWGLVKKYTVITILLCVVCYMSVHDMWNSGINKPEMTETEASLVESAVGIINKEIEWGSLRTQEDVRDALNSNIPTRLQPLDPASVGLDVRNLPVKEESIENDIINESVKPDVPKPIKPKPAPIRRFFRGR